MPSTLDAVQIIPICGVALGVLFNAINKPQYTYNPISNQHEIRILPWVIQIIFSLIWLSYGTNQSDIFIYLLAVPFLCNGIALTLHWHPFYNKRTRKFHEYLLFFSILAFCVISSGTLVQHGRETYNMNIGQIAGGAMLLVSQVPLVLCLIVEKYRVIISEKFGPFEFLVAFSIFFYGGTVTAYGFYGINDWVLSSAGIIWAVFGLMHIFLIFYGMYYHGGLDMGWETDADANYDEEAAIDRLNRANSTGASLHSRTSPRRGNELKNNENYGNQPGPLNPLPIIIA